MSLSIIIPLGPEEVFCRDLLQSISASELDAEIILSACQPMPPEIQLPENTQWLIAEKGRARQLNTGAKAANGKFLWFLHADSKLEAEIFRSVRQIMQQDFDGLAYFKLQFAGDGPVSTRLNALGANIRSRLWDLPFGDQGFLIKKEIFEQLAGFDENVTPGEDLDFVIRFKASGRDLMACAASITTSARRYQRYGWLKTTARHLYLSWKLTVEARQRLQEKS